MATVKFNELEASPTELRQEAEALDDVVGGLRWTLEREHFVMAADSSPIYALISRATELRRMALLAGPAANKRMT